MNRGYKSYKKEAKRTMKIMLKNRGSFFKYLVYLIASFIGKILLFPKVIFDLSDQKLRKEIRNNNKVEISSAFTNHETLSKYWINILTHLITYAIYLGAVLCIAIIDGIIVALGYAVGYTTANQAITKFLIIYLAIPGGVAIVIMTLYFLLLFAPLNYVLANNDITNPTMAIKRTLVATKNGNIKTIFLINLFALLKIAIYVAIVYGLLALENMYFNFVTYEVKVAVFMLIAIIGILLAFFVVGKSLLKRAIMSDALFDDITFNDARASIVINGINLTSYKKVKFDAKSKENNLARLFDETSTIDAKLEEESIDEEETQPEETMQIQEESKQEKNESNNNDEATIENTQEESSINNEEIIEESKEETIKEGE